MNEPKSPELTSAAETRPQGVPKGVPLPTRFTTPDLFVAGPRVWGLRDVFVNLYFVRSDDESLSWVLVDAGLPGSVEKVREAARQLFGPDVPPSAIILTHGHFDHVGALDAYPDVPIYAHPLEMPYLTGLSSYPPPDPVVGGGAMAWMSFLYPRAPRRLGSRVRPLNPDSSVPDLPGWRWVFTPGHAPGHVSLFRDSDRLLIAGDAITTVRGESAYRTFTQTPELNGPPAYFTQDWDAARESVRRLASLEPATVASGHGVPLSGPELRQHLDDLGRDFDTAVRPAKGRYVREPARFDETGVRYVPPPAGLPTAAWVAGAAVVAALGIAALRRSRKTKDSPDRSAPNRSATNRSTPDRSAPERPARRPERSQSAAGAAPLSQQNPEQLVFPHHTDRGYGGLAVGGAQRAKRGETPAQDGKMPKRDHDRPDQSDRYERPDGRQH